MTKTLKQAQHEAAGHRVYTFRELQFAAHRQRKRRETVEDRRQLDMIRPESIATLLHAFDIERADARRVQREMRTHGEPAVVAFYGGLGQLDHYRQLGVRFAAPASGNHRRAAGSKPSRRRGSRRTARGKSPPDDSGDSDGSGSPGPEPRPCAARGCHNPVPPSSGGRPRKYCDDPECVRERERLYKRASRGRKAHFAERVISIGDAAADLNHLVAKVEGVQRQRVEARGEGLLGDAPAGQRRVRAIEDEIAALWAAIRVAKIAQGYSSRDFRGRIARYPSPADPSLGADQQRARQEHGRWPTTDYKRPRVTVRTTAVSS